LSRFNLFPFFLVEVSGYLVAAWHSNHIVTPLLLSDGLTKLFQDENLCEEDHANSEEHEAANAEKEGVNQWILTLTA
jgi:hypothetical protein